MLELSKFTRCNGMNQHGTKSPLFYCFFCNHVLILHMRIGSKGNNKCMYEWLKLGPISSSSCLATRLGLGMTTVQGLPKHQTLHCDSCM